MKDAVISPSARAAALAISGIQGLHTQVISVSGGYSRNRRAIVGDGASWVFVKEVDFEHLSDDGALELGWLRKDYECVNLLKETVPELVPEWARLIQNGQVLCMPAYRLEDGWVWAAPSETSSQRSYIQAVINATKKFEKLTFNQEVIDRLALQPMFRDKLGLDDGVELLQTDNVIRHQLQKKYTQLMQTESRVYLLDAMNQMLELLNNSAALESLSLHAKTLVDQPNNCFGHCDVRSDNLTYNATTGQVKFVDWNWASYTPSGFGATEFLIDMARNGADVTSWVGEFNVELLAATVGFYAKRCLNDSLAPGSTLRDMQAESAAVALKLFNLSIGSRP